MGLISTAISSAASVAKDQYKEFFYCEAIPNDILAVKGRRKTDGGNRHATDNIISTGSVIAVADGQCMLIVEQGRVVEACAEPGEYVFDSSKEPSIFAGQLNKDHIVEVLANVGKRFTHGGQAPTDQRIYYFNTKEILGNKYGTQAPIPFRVVEPQIGLDYAVSLRCFGEYTYKITNPLLFYTNVCGNFPEVYSRDEIDSQLKSEILDKMQPAFAKISDMGIRYTSITGHVEELGKILNELLSEEWANTRGIQIAKFSVSSVTASEEDEKYIKELQRSAAISNAQVGAGYMAQAQAEAMKAAANNQGAGSAMAFMGMNMAQQAGGLNTGDLYAMANQQQQAAQAAQTAQAQAAQTAQAQTQAAPGAPENSVVVPSSTIAPGSWTCACGAVNEGKFCSECGTPKPVNSEWVCSCGAHNTGKFCSECGAAKPV